MKRSIKEMFGPALCVVAALFGHTSPGAPVKITPPDCGLIAAIDSQSTNVAEGIVLGDFEAWYPGLYPGYTWARETAAVTTNGLFHVNYAVLDRHARRQDQLSLLSFRPQFESAVATAPWNWDADARGRLPIAQAKSAVSAHAVHEIEQALLAARYFQANAHLYVFQGFADELSFVSRLPKRIVAGSTYRDLPVRRVRIFLERGRRGLFDLVMEHIPLLADTSRVPAERAVLAEDVSLLHLEYWDGATTSWQFQSRTNMLPPLVRVTVGTGKLHQTSQAPRELTSRIVALQTVGVPANTQRGGPGGRGSRDATTKFWRKASTPPLGKTGGNPASKVGRVPKESVALERQLHWLGRSGVELAKMLLATDLVGASGQIDSLGEPWAAFPQELSLGEGNLSVRITDQERKFNINVAGAPILQQAFILPGTSMEGVEAVDSILDWIDADTDAKQHGAETDYYLRLQPPYLAKNGPIDDLTELLLVRGISPAMFYGHEAPQQTSGLGLIDLFTSVSSRTLNINTATATTLQVLPPVDANVAAAIVRRRAGPDGVDATHDDMPFRNVQELGGVAGLPPPVMQQIQPYVAVRSVFFEVRVRAEIGGVVREFVSILGRTNPRDLRVLAFYAE